MATRKKNTVSHRERKNPRSREDYRAKQRESNAKRGRQEFDPKTKEWIR